MNKNRRITAIFLVLILTFVLLTACGRDNAQIPENTKENITTESVDVDYSEYPEVDTSTEREINGNLYQSFDFSTIPAYSDKDVIEINNNEPMFTDEEKIFSRTYIKLSELDDLGRCQAAMACVGIETEPTEERGDISGVKPSGWSQRQLSDNKWLYNRSHLLMFALTGLNDDVRNLITGTEYFNQTLMLGYETNITWVVDNYNSHVLYRVTPVFEGDNLVAKGVLMEAYSIEYPEECSFCVFVYNVEPGVNIDYATGNSEIV